MSKTSNNNPAPLRAADIETIIKISESIHTIADIPANLALEANKQWKAIRHTQLIQHLTEFRVGVEAEAGVAVANIPTSLGLALADVTEALNIKEPLDLMHVLGADTYLAIYEDPIPYQLPEPWYITVRDLLTKLQDTTISKGLDRLREAWRRRQAPKPEALAR